MMSPRPREGEGCVPLTWQESRTEVRSWSPSPGLTPSCRLLPQGICVL